MPLTYSQLKQAVQSVATGNLFSITNPVGGNFENGPLGLSQVDRNLSYIELG